MISLWNIIGTAVIVLGCIGSFLTGSLEGTITGIISSAFGGIVCYTVSWAMSRLERITEAVELGATREPQKSAATAEPSRPIADPVTYPRAAVSKPATWTCKKCLASNPATSSYCKECGAYK